MPTEEKASSPKAAKKSPVMLDEKTPIVSIAVCPPPFVTTDDKPILNPAKQAQQVILDQIAASAVKDDMSVIFTALSIDDASSRKFLKQILVYDLIDFNYINKTKKNLVSYLIENGSEQLLEILFNDFIKTRDNISDDKHLAEMAFYFASRGLVKSNYYHLDSYLKNLDSYDGIKNDTKQRMAKTFLFRLIDETITPDELRNLSKHLTEARNKIPYLSTSLVSLALPFFSNATYCWQTIMQKREARMEELAKFHDVSKKECGCGHKSFF